MLSLTYWKSDLENQITEFCNVKSTENVGYDVKDMENYPGFKSCMEKIEEERVKHRVIISFSKFKPHMNMVIGALRLTDYLPGNRLERTLRKPAFSI